MKVVTVTMKTLNEAKHFVDIATRFPCELTLASGRYVVNAKSSLGVFSLDFLKNVELRIYAEDAEAEEILTALRDYIV